MAKKKNTSQTKTSVRTKKQKPPAVKTEMSVSDHPQTVEELLQVPQAHEKGGSVSATKYSEE